MNDDLKAAIKELLEGTIAERLEELGLINTIHKRKELPTFLEDINGEGYDLPYQDLTCSWLESTSEGTDWVLRHVEWFLPCTLLKNGLRGHGNDPFHYYTGRIGDVNLVVRYNPETGDPILSGIEMNVTPSYRKERR